MPKQIFQIKPVEKSIKDTQKEGHSLKRQLTSFDLAIMGVAVAVGAGIFSVGANVAAFYAGPAVTISFVLATVTCGFAIMSYAEFASTVPVSGSAYTYTYSTMGELMAWIIGWDLILELVVGASLISRFWGVYLDNFFTSFGLNVPQSFHIGGMEVNWAPIIIVALFTTLLVRGTKLSTRVNNIFTAIKIGIVLFVIVVGAFYVKSANYHPFIPPAVSAKGGNTGGVLEQSILRLITGTPPAEYGWLGIMSGAAIVFFAFVGFDIVATSAEEVKDPQKNFPKGIFMGLGIVSVLYLLVSLVITGMLPYTEFAKQKDPSLASAFIEVGAPWAAGVISFGILIGLTSVIMVLLLGMSRVVFSMSRDGLLPYNWSKTDEKAGTPARIQIVGGIIVSFIASCTNIMALEEMINIGSLSAFILVSIAVIIMRKKRPDIKRGYKVPFVPAIPIIAAVLCFYLILNLTAFTWVRFLIWLAIGFVIYFTYSMKHSRLNIEDETVGNESENLVSTLEENSAPGSNTTVDAVDETTKEVR
ncbi:MAG: amino acid permease [Micrococcaceae bacterium]